MNILVTHIYFILPITWYLAYGCGKQLNRWDRKCTQINDNFGGHGDAAVQRDAHRPMEHIPGFNRSHWMPPSAECSHHIALAAAMVKEFEWNTQNTNETQLLASNYGTFWLLVVCENFVPQNGPSLVKMWNATIVAEEFSYISSCQMLSADKHSKNC